MRIRKARKNGDSQPISRWRSPRSQQYRGAKLEAVPIFPRLAIVFALLPMLAQAQQPTELKAVLDRLDRLESQNQALMTEIRALRQQLSVSSPVQPVEE